MKLEVEIKMEGGKKRLCCWHLKVVGKDKEKSRASASLLVPLHSNPRRGSGNVQLGKQANTHKRTVYLRRQSAHMEDHEEEEKDWDWNRREKGRKKREGPGGGQTQGEWAKRVRRCVIRGTRTRKLHREGGPEVTAPYPLVLRSNYIIKWMLVQGGACRKWELKSYIWIQLNLRSRARLISGSWSTSDLIRFENTWSN